MVLNFSDNDANLDVQALNVQYAGDNIKVEIRFENLA